ncbi:MAG: c-type cytochrome [Planctomycetota bacterium]|mgnify:CR=1 FL=1|nr:c-type cytochrome [Planctomycetota bacterium]MDA1249480.1 c-type cytochrome [Planctomycetota bacterium]
MNRFFACAAGFAATFGTLAAVAENSPETTARPAADSVAVGKELFHREWLANDPRSHGGDGLGPVFNESSCVACHNQGGAGGGGAASNNVAILTISPNFPSVKLTDEQRTALRQELSNLRLAVGLSPADETTPETTSLVIHRFGLSEQHGQWKNSLQSQLAGVLQAFPSSQPIRQAQFVQRPAVSSSVGFQQLEFVTPISTNENLLTRFASRLQQFQSASTTARSTTVHGSHILTTSQRNATALFGVGLIDSITDEQIEAAASKKHAEFPQVTGRVSRTKDGKIGRFGWKADTTSLKAFTMAACAVELGLHVPGHAQASIPYDQKYEPAGLDLNAAELNSLTDYLSDLPQPVERTPDNKAAADLIHQGRELFAAVGCTTCHSPSLGDVEGIYSDLLLHDLGPHLSDVGTSYGQSVPDPLPLADANDDPGQPKSIPALASEWKTPALWGCRDSGPYLHDGRADSLEQAIALHDGEAQDSTMQFLMLTPQKRQLLVAFLKTLRAPEK